MPLRRLLVAAEIAMSVVLLVSAGLLMTTLRNLQSVDPGFRAANLIRMDYNLPVSRYPRDFAVWPDWPEVNQFHHELVRRVEAIPGVESATITTNHPLQSGFTNSFSMNDQPVDRNQGEITTRIVTPGYFETVGLELVSGRLMDRTDDTQTPFVAMINRAAAERYCPDGDALGSTIEIWGPVSREVIGIVGNERIHGLDAEPPPTLYVNMYQAPPRPGAITLMVETTSNPTGLTASVRETIWSLDADLAVFNVSTMEQTLRDATARERFTGVLSTVFSGVALFLALLGIHGVLSYAVAQRRHEVGIRMALGATRRDVLGLIVSQGMAMTIVGLVIGLAAAVAVTRLFGNLLFGVEPFDVRAYGAVALLLGTVALLATALPARKASRIDPMTPLRGE
jgi:predicted permease